MSAAPVLAPGPDQHSDRAVRRLLAFASFFVFLSYCRIVTRNGPERFDLWDHQRMLANLFLEGKSVIILKARQLGVSWLIAAYVLWVAMSRPYSVILLLSQGEREANELLAKVFRIWHFLPGWLKTEPELTKHTVAKPASMEFANGSSIIALPSTENAGRSFTATLVVVDEAAFHPWAEANYAAYEPTLDGGGQLIMCSTSSGPSGLFHDLYRAAEQRQNDFVPVFIPWWSRPDRQAKGPDGKPNGQPSPKWFERTRNRFQGTVQQFRAEYPATVGEAFSAVTGLVYGMDDDGVLIFSRERHPIGNISEDPVPWEDCRWHYAAIDWGGGDPTAIGFYGVTHWGRAHKYYEHHWTRAITVEEAHEALIEHAGRWPDGTPQVTFYDAVVCGVEEKSAIRTLAAWGWRAKPARVARAEGFGYTKYVLKHRLLTFHPDLEFTIREFDSYYWARRRDQRTGEEYDTSTPQDHHGDHMDEMRYFVFEWQMAELGRREDADAPVFGGVRLGGRR